MKLVELISEEKIIIKEEAIKIEPLTRLSVGGIDYKWNEKTKQWVDAKTNNPAKAGVAAKLTKTYKGLNAKPNFSDPSKARAVPVNNGFLVNLKDQTFKFTTEKDANKFITKLKGGKSIPTALKDFKPESFKELGRNAFNKFKIGVSLTAEQADDLISKSSRLTKIATSPYFTGFFKLLGILGINVALYKTYIINYDQVASTPDSEFKEGGAAEKEELLDIITGLFVSQVILVTSMAFRVIRVVTLVNLIRTPIRAMQLGGAATGVGTVPSLITMIVTEAAFWGATYLLTRPGVQMKLAEYIASVGASVFFGAVGAAADTIAVSLNSVTNGALGGATLRDALTFKKGVKKMPTGTAHASSEWAKLAFQDMIFPPDMEKVKVPYLILGDRTNAIYDALEIDPSQRPSAALKPKPMSSGQLGQLSDYVFLYTPEMADKLKDTHELVAVSDRAGSRPGGENQELYLAPTPQALASATGPEAASIPMPTNRVVTRTGTRIERDTTQDPTQDPIVKIASDAINATNTNQSQADAAMGPR